jgi:aminoglycoside 6'-N-acetyltransferase I
MTYIIRLVTPADAATWQRLRTAHWPDGAADHGPEIAAFFAGTAAEPQAVFLAENDGQAVAVMELSIRTDLPPLLNVKVGYVEGFYIVPEFRGRGLARQLLRFAQDWARQQHCPAFASDRAGRLIVDPHYQLNAM